MFLYRDHRGMLDESMETIEEMESHADLVRHVESLYGSGDIEVKHYAQDDRIGWDTYIVIHNGRAVGFTNGPTE